MDSAWDHDDDVMDNILFGTSIRHMLENDVI